MKLARLLLKSLVFLVGTVILFLLAGFCWLYFYSRDLPDIRPLSQYAPSYLTQASGPCLGSSTAIPYEAIGENVGDGIRAAETREDDPGAFRATVGGLLRGEARHRRTSVASWYISRTMFCNPSKMLNRQLAEIRTAIQLERHFSRRQLFTMFANRVYLGPEVIGVQKGSTFYFNKNSADLTVSEAALLVALIGSPSMYSPSKHPDRALRRRNDVIDAMQQNSSITAAEAELAKSAPLGIVAGEKTAAQ